MVGNALTLWLDMAGNRLVESDTLNSDFALPRFYRGDVLPLKIFLLERTGSIRTPFTRVTDATLTVTAGIVPPAAPTSSILAQASLTFLTDHWEGTLDLGTAEIVTLLGSATEAGTTFEVEVAAGTGERSTEYQAAVTVRADGFQSGTPAPVAGVTYPTHAEVSAGYVKKVGAAGEGITLTSPDGTKQAILWLTNDGEFRADPVT